MVDKEVIFSPAGVEIILCPFLVGEKLEKLASQATSDFVDHWIAKTANTASLGAVIHLDILRGGHYYFLEDNLKKLSVAAGKAEIRAKRRQDKISGQWIVDITEIKDNAMQQVKDAQTIFIGDTIATGGTLSGVLSWILKIRGEHKQAPDVAIFTICGGHVALKRLEEVAAVYKRKGGSLTITFANAIFDLAENGTDLQLTTSTWERRAHAVVNYTLMFDVHDDMADTYILQHRKTIMKCACWDWGERFYSSHTQLTHLKEVSAYFNSLQNSHPPLYILDGLKKSIKELEPQPSQSLPKYVVGALVVGLVSKMAKHFIQRSQ